MGYNLKKMKTTIKPPNSLGGKSPKAYMFKKVTVLHLYSCGAYTQYFILLLTRNIPNYL